MSNHTLAEKILLHKPSVGSTSFEVSTVTIDWLSGTFLVHPNFASFSCQLSLYLYAIKIDEKCLYRQNCLDWFFYLDYGWMIYCLNHTEKSYLYLHGFRSFD